MSRIIGAQVDDRPAHHASYRVRPRKAHALLMRPIRFTTESDDHARYLFDTAKASLFAQGIPVFVIDLVLERLVDDTWTEVAVR